MSLRIDVVFHLTWLTWLILAKNFLLSMFEDSVVFCSGLLIAGIMEKKTIYICFSNWFIKKPWEELPQLPLRRRTYMDNAPHSLAPLHKASSYVCTLGK